jgi:hypothetical protein
MGVNRALVDKILVDATVIALVGVFREMKIGSDEELAEVLRECLSNFR